MIATAKSPPTTQPLTLALGTAIIPTGWVFSYLPRHLDLASEDSVGHSTCMSVLARRRAIVGSIVQPKRSCLGAVTGTAGSPHRWGKYHTHPTAKNPPTTQPLNLTLTHQPRHDSHRQKPTNHRTANPNPNPRYSYFTDRWSILLFTPPPRSRV